MIGEKGSSFNEDFSNRLTSIHGSRIILAKEKQPLQNLNPIFEN